MWIGVCMGWDQVFDVLVGGLACDGEVEMIEDEKWRQEREGGVQMCWEEGCPFGEGVSHLVS